MMEEPIVVEVEGGGWYHKTVHSDGDKGSGGDYNDHNGETVEVVVLVRVMVVIQVRWSSADVSIDVNGGCW